MRIGSHLVRRFVHGHPARPAVPRPVTGRAVDARAGQPALDDPVGSELVHVRAVRRVTLDDDGHATDGATRRRHRPCPAARHQRGPLSNGRGHSLRYVADVDGLLVGVLAAVAGLSGVALGALLQGRREHERWLRDQKLRAAIGFIGSSGILYEQRRKLGNMGPSPVDEAAEWSRLQDSRSALYLLCNGPTVTVAEDLAQRVKRVEPAADGSHDEDAISLLRDLVRRLRGELGVGPPR
jgi:hypothetical protein